MEATGVPVAQWSAHRDASRMQGASVDTRARPLPRLVVAARASRGWSQGALCKATGLPKEKVYRLERGQHEPKLETALAVMDALGIPADVMLAAVRDDAATVDRYIITLAASGSRG